MVPEQVNGLTETDWHVGVAGRVPVPPVWTSATPTLVSVTLPLLVTVKLEVSTCDAVEAVAGETDLLIVSDAVWVTAALADDGSDVYLVPPVGVPDAVALSARAAPLFTSARVVT